MYSRWAFVVGKIHRRINVAGQGVVDYAVADAISGIALLHNNLVEDANQFDIFTAAVAVGVHGEIAGIEAATLALS